MNVPEQETEKKPTVSTISDQLFQTVRTLQSFREKSLFTDVILCVGKEELPCHKAVLAASSQYFNAMFSSPYKEQQTSHVILEHISPWALRRLLDFAYLGILELSPTTVQDVFMAASLLDYPLAVKACVGFMENHLDITNCLGVEALAELHGLTNLAKLARKLATENFMSLVLESSEWVDLPLPCVISYLSSDDLDVPSERFVWDACINWVDHDFEERESYFPILLSHVRLRYLEQGFLASQLDENGLIQESTKARDYIKRFLSEGHRKSGEFTHLPPRPATLKRPTLVVFGGLNTCILNCMQSLSPSRAMWQPCPSLPVDSLAWFSVTVIANNLFVLGGIKAGILMDTVYSYSPIRNSWIQRTSMPQGRARHSSVAVGSRYIYVFGGLTMIPGISSHPPFQSVSPDNPNRPHRRSYGDSQSLFSSLSDSDLNIPTLQLANTISRYDILGDSWTSVGETDQPRLESHMVLIDEPTSINEGFQLSPSSRLPDYGNDFDNDQCSPRSELSELSETCAENNNSNGQQSNNRRRHHSSYSNTERTFVEIGGITETHPQGTDQISFYRLRPDLTVFRMADYIKLPKLFRYVNCAFQQETNLLYLFWETTSELSVLDLRRHTLRSLAPLVTCQSIPARETRIHAGLTWVGDRLYVVGGFCELVGDRRPTMPRDDIHCYDPVTDKWSEVKVTNTTIPRAVFGCVCLNM